ITCSSTNSSSGTTCSSGDEQLGVAFTPTTTGAAEVCVTFSHYADNESNAVVSRQFKINQTANNSQTPTTSGSNIKGSLMFPQGARNGVTNTIEICDVF